MAMQRFTNSANWNSMVDAFGSALQGCVRLHARCSPSENLASSADADAAAASRAQLDCVAAVLAVRGDTKEEFLARADHHLANLHKVLVLVGVRFPTGTDTRILCNLCTGLVLTRMLLVY